MIPAITTGMIDFMINSGLITDIAAIPVPDLAVPYAAPSAEKQKYFKFQCFMSMKQIHTYASYIRIHVHERNYEQVSDVAT